MYEHDFVHVTFDLRPWPMTDGETDGRYQVHYFPVSLSYAVDNKKLVPPPQMLYSVTDTSVTHSNGIAPKH